MIFGIGLSRTGGTSLAAALRKLGYKTYHHIDFRYLYQLVNSDLTLNHSYLQRFDALVDLPAVINYKKLDKRFPDSQFILTICKNRKKHLQSLKWLHTKVRPWLSFFPYILAMDKEVWGQLHFDEKAYEKKYQEYIKEVQSYFKGRKNKLFIMDVTQGDGYDKLCSFLGKETLQEKFPHKNKKWKKSFGKTCE